MALAVLGAGRHLLLEGPVGVGKTTVALAVCAHLGRTTVRVDGDDRYSESKLTGWFDPPLVLQQGYREESFFAGTAGAGHAGRRGALHQRAQPHARDGAERAAAGARRTPRAGAPHRRGEGRRRLSRRGHAESRRVRGHRPSVGGPARPLRAPVARLPVGRRRRRHRPPRDGLRRGRAAHGGRPPHASDQASSALSQGSVRARRGGHGRHHPGPGAGGLATIAARRCAARPTRR